MIHETRLTMIEAKKRGPEGSHVKARNQSACQLKHQRIDDQNEEPEREDCQRKSQKKQDGPNQGIQNAEDSRRPQTRFPGCPLVRRISDVGLSKWPQL